jgi:hypothetical protein
MIKRRAFITLLGGVGHGRARSNSRAGTISCAGCRSCPLL